MVGVLSDRMRVRRPIVIAFAAAYSVIAIGWAVLPAPAAGGVVIAAVLTGLAVPGFTLSWSIAKEVNAPACAGMAIAIANIGGFAASGILQPLVGWVVDSGAGIVTGGSPDAYRLGMAILALWSLIGVVAACRLSETYCRNIWRP
jgi:MFS family permease